MSYLRLLSTDFDGTLIAHPSDGRCSPKLAAVLDEHRTNGGLWALNTGRGFDHAVEGVVTFQGPYEPDFLLTNEREIHVRTAPGTWESDADWNGRCQERHEELFARAGSVFTKIRELASSSSDVTLIHEHGVLVGLVTTSERVMEDVAGFLDRETRHLSEFSYQRNTVYLRFCHRDYHKGAALGGLCRRLSISREEVFSAGDHFNDLSMLDGTYAAYPCCPSNAIPEVKTTVLAAGGYVASQPAGEGIAEAWAHFSKHP